MDGKGYKLSPKDIVYKEKFMGKDESIMVYGLKVFNKVVNLISYHL